MAKKPKSTGKSAFTTRIDDKVLAEARAACHALPRITFCDLVEDAVRKRIQELRKKHNKGKPFRSRRKRLTPGPPPGS